MKKNASVTDNSEVNLYTKFYSNESLKKKKKYIKSSIPDNLDILSTTNDQKTRRKRQVMKDSDTDGAVMYIPVSSTSACPAGSNSVADASVTGISQVYLRYIIIDTYMDKYKL